MLQTSGSPWWEERKLGWFGEKKKGEGGGFSSCQRRFCTDSLQRGGMWVVVLEEVMGLFLLNSNKQTLSAVIAFPCHPLFSSFP